MNAPVAETKIEKTVSGCFVEDLLIEASPPPTPHVLNTLVKNVREAQLQSLHAWELSSQ